MTTIDYALIIVYLIMTIIIGYKGGQKVKTMEQFSSADKTLPTTALVATIFATLIGGDDILGTGEFYKVGITFLVINLAQIICFFGHIYIYTPKILREFSDKISVGEIMGELYGKPGQVMTGIAAMAQSVGYLAAQICTLGYVYTMFPGISHFWGTLIGSAVVILYSSYGGIRSVISTDVLQFGILIVAIPIMANIALFQAGGVEVLIEKLPSSYLEFFPAGEDFWGYIALFLVCAFPRFTPAMAQRTLIAKDVRQAQKSFMIAGGLFFPFYLAIAIIALCAVITKLNCEPNMVFLTVLNNSLPPVLKGFALIGVLAVVMSTADSHMNIASISLTKDILLPIFPELDDKKQLISARIGTVIIGIYAVFMANCFNRVIEFWIWGARFWMPLVTAPLILFIFGIRITARQYIFSIIFGAAAVVISGIFNIYAFGMISPFIGLIVTISLMIIFYKFSGNKFKYNRI